MRACLFYSSLNFYSGTAGSANNQFNGPSDIVRIPSSGTLYIADTFNHRIMEYMFNASSGTVVAGGNGAGNNITQLNLPFCFAFRFLVEQLFNC